MKIIIHCGAYKTGSSSIQNYFYLNRGILEERFGIFYPTAGIYRSPDIGFRHAKLFYSFGKESWGKYVSAMQSQLLDARSRGCSVALISSEALSNPATHPSLVEFLRLLDTWGFSDVEAIVYVRNWYDYVIRHYREFTLRHRNIKPIPGYLRKYYNTFDYPGVFCSLLDVFSEKVALVSYEHVGFVLNDLCGRLGLIDPFLEAGRSNPGWSAVDIEFARCCNHKRISPKNAVYSKQAEDELGVFFSPSISELPSLFASTNWLLDLNWIALKEKFLLADEQIELILKKPANVENKNVYEISDIISAAVDKLVNK